MQARRAERRPEWPRVARVVRRPRTGGKPAASCLSSRAGLGRLSFATAEPRLPSRALGPSCPLETELQREIILGEDEEVECRCAVRCCMRARRWCAIRLAIDSCAHGVTYGDVGHCVQHVPCIVPGRFRGEAAWCVVRLQPEE